MKNWPFKMIHKSGCLSILRNLKNTDVTVLSLHKISYEKNFFFPPITPALFEELLKYLKKNYQVVTFSQLGNVSKGKRPLAAISFDDGYYDFIENAVPLLEKYNLSCNHNVVIECLDHNMIIWTEKLNAIFQKLMDSSIPNLVIRVNDKEYRYADSRNWIHYYDLIFKHMCHIEYEERNNILTELLDEFNVNVSVSMMSWEHIKRLNPSLVEIGSHTCTHDILSTITDKERIYFELVNSKKRLEEELAREVSILALPNGFANKTVLEVASKAGYKNVLSVSENSNKLTQTNYINRLNVVQEDKSAMFCRIEGVHTKIKSIFNHE